jgi:xanthine dehydrogenase accessory factor
VSSERVIFAEAARLAAAGEPFVLVTVIATKGSTPRDPGAKILWRPGAPLLGTVGGGQFERLVIDAAAMHFERRSCGQEHLVLHEDADQCCGGTMDVFYEYCGPRQRLVVFGAGHVAKALIDALAPAAIETIVVDDRPEWNSADRFPRSRRLLEWDTGVHAARERPEETFVCVMTCSHDTDFDLLRRLLDRSPGFVGLIGSRSKRACLFSRLIASGANESAVQRVHCPIGLGDMGKEPELVAISIAGQILLEMKRLDESRARA